MTEDRTSVENLGLFEGCVLALGSLFQEGVHVWGSAALVAPGLAISAAHVIEEFLSQGHVSDGQGDLLCFGVSDDTKVWSVVGITLVGDTDTAILYLELHGRFSGARIDVVTLTTKLPALGERISVAGFRADADRFIPDRDPMRLELLIAAGRVTDIHPNGLGLIRGPHFSIEAPALGGMSGGPAFNENGDVVGILSGSMNLDGDTTGRSCISLLWPAMLSTIHPKWPSKWYPEPFKMVDGAFGLYLEGGDRLRTITNPQGGEAWQHKDLPGL